MSKKTKTPATEQSVRISAKALSAVRVGLGSTIPTAGHRITRAMNALAIITAAMARAMGQEKSLDNIFEDSDGLRTVLEDVHEDLYWVSILPDLTQAAPTDDQRHALDGLATIDGDAEV